MDELLAVVSMVKVDVGSAAVSESELREQVGAGVDVVVIEQASVTVPVKPAPGVMVIVEVADPPGLTDACDRVPALSVKVATAVPVRLTVCELPAALSVIVMVAVRLPVAVGAKVTVIVHLAPAATEVQVLVSLKSPASVPESATFETVRLVTSPLFVMVTVCAALLVPTAWLENVRVVADREAAAAVAVPVRLITCGFPAVSVIVMVAVRVPRAVGVKLTVIAQLAPAATEVQVLVSLKSPASVPESATLETVRLVMFPLFVIVTSCDTLVVPTA